jgi:hypothetical protein
MWLPPDSSCFPMRLSICPTGEAGVLTCGVVQAYAARLAGDAAGSAEMASPQEAAQPSTSAAEPREAGSYMPPEWSGIPSG